MFRKVAIGGTFDRLHTGHMELLKRAFEAGRFVIIGLTSDEMVDKEVASFKVRKEKLEDFLRALKEYRIIKINDAYGPTIEDASIEAIIVSEETEFRAREINKLRGKKDLKPLEIITVKIILAEDGKPVSSRRIRRGEIDVYGKVL